MSSLNAREFSPLRLRVLIAEDEPLARAKLVRILGETPDVDVVGVAASGREAIRMAEERRPDLVFLDIHLPDVSGLEIARNWSHRVDRAVVFVTAYAHHAIEAFELNALHYLLKPFNRTRVEEALLRARSGRIRLSVEEAVKREALGVVPESRRMVISTADGILSLAPADIDWLKAADNYVQVHAGTAVHLVRGTLASFEQQLATDRFQRIHRSKIVNLERVRKLKTNQRGQLEAHLVDGTSLVVSRRYRSRIRTLWRGWSGQGQ